MFVYLSKLLPPLIYPLGLGLLCILAALLLGKRPSWQRASLWLALAVIWLAGNSWVAMSITRSLEWRYPPLESLPQADVIVLLGGGTQSAQPPRSIVEVNSAGDRVIYAAWLYHQGVAPVILLSGGDIEWYGSTENPAEDMACLLSMLNVPAAALWIENQSRNTYENALFSAKMLAEAGVDRIVLVTSAAHMPRSVALFEHQGLSVIPAPADYTVTVELWDQLWQFDLLTQFINFWPSAGNLDATTIMLKEYLGMFIYRLRGWM